MNEILFEWDENKNATNRKKHGISFEEAEKMGVRLMNEEEYRYL